MSKKKSKGLLPEEEVEESTQEESIPDHVEHPKYQRGVQDQTRKEMQRDG